MDGEIIERSAETRLRSMSFHRLWLVADSGGHAVSPVRCPLNPFLEKC